MRRNVTGIFHFRLCRYYIYYTNYYGFVAFIQAICTRKKQLRQLTIMFIDKVVNYAIPLMWSLAMMMMVLSSHNDKVLIFQTRNLAFYFILWLVARYNFERETFSDVAWWTPVLSVWFSSIIYIKFMNQ